MVQLFFESEDISPTELASLSPWLLRIELDRASMVAKGLQLGKYFFISNIFFNLVPT
jgi:hypothetical protein